jgi:hypothetical protein
MLARGLDITIITLWLGHASPAAARHFFRADPWMPSLLGKVYHRIDEPNAICVD